MTWTTETVEAEFEAAGRALRRMPGNDLARLGRIPCLWPEVQNDDQWSTMLGRFKGTRSGDNRVWIGATNRDVTALDRCLFHWLQWLQPGDVRWVQGERVTLPRDIRAITLSHYGLGGSWALIGNIRRARRIPGANSKPMLRRFGKAGIQIIATRANRAEAA